MKPLRFLLLEDSVLDADLIQASLIEGDIDCQLVRVETRADFVATLERDRFDLILADYSLPSFDGISALEITRGVNPSVPFIFVSGTLGEELAIETLKKGATDYVVKQRLERLVPSVRRALREAAERAERRRAEEERQRLLMQVERERQRAEGLATEAQQRAGELDAVFAALSDAVVVYDANGTPLHANPAAIAAYGLDPTGLDREAVARRLSIRHPDGRFVDVAELPSTRALRGERVEGERFLFTNAAGDDLIILASAAPLVTDGRPSGAVCIWHDVTERERLLEQLTAERARLEAVLRQMPAGVIIVEAPSGKMILCNEQAERLWRRPRAKAADGEPYPEYAGFHANGRPYEPEEWPMARAIRTGEVVTDEEIQVMRSDGACGTMRVSAAPIRDREGRIVAGVTTFYDITKQKRLEEELRRRAEQLAAAARAKDEFLGMLSHELRNPLAAILHALHLMRLPGASAMVERSLAVAERQVGHMARLLDDLLDVARITRGRIELRKAPVELGTICSHAIETVRPLIEARGHLLCISLPPEPVWLDGDPTRLEQVLTNLLSNAARYTEPGGRVWLSAEREGEEVVLRVQDTGIGISPELLPRVFDLFTQADQSLDRARGGLGVGLTVVRSLVEMHGGRVQAYSAGPGQGSEFVVRLPMGAGSAVPKAFGMEQTEDEGRPYGPYEPREDECAPRASVFRSPASVPADSPSPSRALQSKRVLVVEDNAHTAETLAEILGLWGHTVRVAYDGPAAIEAARRLQPQVVLLDIGLPGMDGFEVARRLREQVGLDDATLVALTGYGREEDRRRCLEAGFGYHLVKPVDLADLQQLLAR
ncbi:MAG: response regulator [Armatimonadetes bacterium]|nr:response regulator [Armatimonadota bacterium]